MNNWEGDNEYENILEPESRPATFPRKTLSFLPWLKANCIKRTQLISESNILSKPMIDFSSVSAFPSFSFRFRARSSSAISLIVERRRLNILFCLVGRYCRIGRTGPIRNTKWDSKLVSPLPKASNTSITGDSLPSRAWKSCPKPAIPMESRLRGSERYISNINR